MRMILGILLGVAAGLAGRHYFAAEAVASAPVEVAAASPAGVVVRQDKAMPGVIVPPTRFVDPGNPVFPVELEVRSIATRGRRAIVGLSDGSTLTERDRELISTERNSVTICALPHRAFDDAGRPVKCPNCRKYPLKTAPTGKGGRLDGLPGASLPEVVRPERKEGAPMPTGAANPPRADYAGEAVIPINGTISTEFTIGRKS